MLTGLYGTDRSHNFGDLPVNEAATGVVLSNTKGTVSIAHHDVPDNGNTEFFINLGSNDHLDTAYGGYCVFAQVADDSSMAVCEKIAAEVKGGTQTLIHSVTVA
ncbi:hypothetical protein T484DRAFT_1848670 [Baffinella frigidus]|nr:hypothetical protein T484DRAFT_1848670 [Cryptophyta sp. CCMP2293]